VDVDEASGLPDAAALGEVLEEGAGLLLGQVGVEQGRTVARGEAVFAGLAVKQPDVVVRAVAGAEREICGVASAEDALQYVMAGASLVGVGTAAMRDPRAPERIVAGLERWCARHDVKNIQELTGTLEWPT